MREKQENERRGKGLKQYIADRRLAAVSLVLGVLMGLMILLGIRYSRNDLPDGGSVFGTVGGLGGVYDGDGLGDLCGTGCFGAWLA